MMTTAARCYATRISASCALPTTSRRSPVPESILRSGPTTPQRRFIFSKLTRISRISQTREFSNLRKDNPAGINTTLSSSSRKRIQSVMAQSANTHHIVVALEASIVPVPPLDLPAPHTYELREYGRTRPEEVAERVKDADVVIVTIVQLKADILRPEMTPRLKMVAVVASGTDCVDLAACRARGIVVGNTPHCNTVSVAEHVVALYFATRRSVALVHTMVQSGEWRKEMLHNTLNGPDGRAPRTCRDETLGIIGYGAVGKALESTAKSLGMKVLISGRKGASTVPEGRTPFDTLIRESSVIALCLPRSPETMNMISNAELDAMKPYAVIVNVSRGGIVDEKALLTALKSRKIAGYGTDVYEQEPANPDNSPLVGPDVAGLNIVTTPHVAWCAGDTISNYNRATKENIAGWLTTGQPKYSVV
ncbi:D-isomer specific 2-hydroxyacid dehydrogenase [Daldinia vernicosa]|uniref:D-isomer specific 2-hydroxyacid dehydrogenase n=1 Tax=Daldinia vernicosa TaxID=114800 RepID=UPI0020072218|nr:D-isomer specific 2-hydroxyacid dehydrogenase [Daldinia vernicosa]KAI0852824.1 D-isomer specific 2-hydroxyacid dehydrogenase [Daldinia vernicosa]